LPTTIWVAVFSSCSFEEGAFAAQIEGKKTRGSKTNKKRIIFLLIMLELERFLEIEATVEGRLRFFFLDQVMNLDTVFRFHINSIILLVGG
jgi:hypothetical protein